MPKRGDQHRLDPGEGAATDYKFRRTAEDGLHRNVDEEGGQPTKPTAPSPDAKNPKEAARDEDEDTKND